jgi:hypothetical protein
MFEVKLGISETADRAAIAVVSANRSNGSRKVATTSPSSLRRWRAACLASSSGGAVPFEQPLASRPV